MSYILDALRRADAERERGAVPGLHARPLPGAEAATPSTRRLPVAAWVLLGVAAGGALPLAWWWGRSAAPGPAAVVASGAAPASGYAPPSGSASASESTLASGPAVPLSQTRAVEVPATRPSVAPVSASPTPTQRAPLTQAPQVRAAPAASALPASASAPAHAASAAAEPRATPLAELPAELRRQLPPLALGGSVYSDTPASRFVMVSGQLVREGEAAAPGVIVQRIGPKSLLLRWRDRLLEVPL